MEPGTEKVRIKRNLLILSDAPGAGEIGSEMGGGLRMLHMQMPRVSSEDGQSKNGMRHYETTQNHLFVKFSVEANHHVKLQFYVVFRGMILFLCVTEMYCVKI